ncbi:putative oxidoreductase [Lachnellula suecica]|uniref:Putative oxidoreductase n=1 Tax=Lachnellula suecica TaxID=602035 RepID=A0A8T9CLN0_9HELO|nr:putative oxidoreductase [Lachnellula suecica]
MGVTYSQFFPPAPALTEENVPSLSGKVFIVTGGASGIGFELAKILFRAAGKVYIAGRSEENARQSITKIQSTAPKHASNGQLEFLYLKLDDLSTIKASVDDFSRKEAKLDVLWNNAGVSLPPLGSTSSQGHELQVATNCLGPYLFTQLLLPKLQAAAQSSAPGSARVVWTSSQMVDLTAPKKDSFMADVITPSKDNQRNYFITKIGNWFLASELAREVAPSGIISVVQNPGNLNTNLLRHVMWMKYMSYPLLHKARKGAYTELWAGLSPDINLESTGCYIIPWGRVHPAPRAELVRALKSSDENGSGLAKQFWDWCESQTIEFR